MKLPYGISDFKSLREQGYLYVDKTAYIEQLEALNSKYLFFIRPRRFGKSLFLSTLAHYYDLAAERYFDTLYGDLYVGRNRTPLVHRYLVLRLNFSGLDTSGRESLARSFRNAVVDDIQSFAQKYQRTLGDVAALQRRLEQSPSAGDALRALIAALRNTEHKVYLIVDEYDHFANDILAMGDGAFYKELVRASGLVRDFYEAVKIGTESAIDRLFITGVSPIMLDDLTSGFNISRNLTMEPAIHGMLGFTEDELRAILQTFTRDLPAGAVPPNDLLDELRKNYNGYLFHPDETARLYNPDMVLHFLDHWQMRGRYPGEIMDDNVKTDYGRLQRLVTSERNREQINAIIRDERVSANIVSRFSFDRMYDEAYFVSLLFYMGLLTIGGTRYGLTELVIPNYAVKTMYWTYFEDWLRRAGGVEVKSEALAHAVWTMATEGRLQPFVDFIREQVLSVLSNRDLIRFDEKHLKLILLAYLNLTRFYRLRSEQETETGYIDLYLERLPSAAGVVYEWLLELKYLKQSEADRLEAVKEEGVRQLAAYAAVSRTSGLAQVRQALLLFVGKGKIVVVEP